MKAPDEYLINYAMGRGVLTMSMNPGVTIPVFPKDYSFIYKGGVIPYYTAVRQMLLTTDPGVVAGADEQYTREHPTGVITTTTTSLSKKVLGLELKYWLIFGAAFVATLFYIKRK